MKHWIGRWFDVVLFCIFVVIYFWVWGEAFGDKEISAELWKMLIPLSKDSISAGITATSILLPSAIIIMIYLLEKNNATICLKDAVSELFFVTLSFIISLSAAILNFTHLPIRLKENIHICFDWVPGILAITQFSFLALGIFKLLKVTFYIRKEFLEKK